MLREINFGGYFFFPPFPIGKPLELYDKHLGESENGQFLGRLSQF